MNKLKFISKGGKAFKNLNSIPFINKLGSFANFTFFDNILTLKISLK